MVFLQPPGTKMDTGHLRVIESRGLVCWCKWGSAVNRGERESTRLTQAAFTFHQDSCRNFQNSFPVLIWGQCPASPVYFPHRARMTLKNIGLTPTCFPSSTAAHASEHRCSKAPCSLACWSLWSPKGRAGRQAHSITRGRTEGCGKWAGRNGNSIQGHVLTWSPIWDCTCYSLLRSCNGMPQAPPIQGGEGSIWV